MDWDKLAEELKKELDPSYIRQRKTGWGEVDYLPTWRVKEQANELFGYGQWSSRLKRLEQVLVEETTVWVKNWKTGKREQVPGWLVIYFAEVSLTVGDTTHENAGTGVGTAQSKAEAYETAIKGAPSDALKRCFTSFGPQFGLYLARKDDEPAEDGSNSKPEPESRESGEAQQFIGNIQSITGDDNVEGLKPRMGKKGPYYKLQVDDEETSKSFSVNAGLITGEDKQTLLFAKGDHVSLEYTPSGGGFDPWIRKIQHATDNPTADEIIEEMKEEEEVPF